MCLLHVLLAIVHCPQPSLQCLAASLDAGADPYLAELYRRVQSTEVLASIRVQNAVGGVQLPGMAYLPPRYERVAVPRRRLLLQLQHDTDTLRYAISHAKVEKQRQQQQQQYGGDHSSSRSTLDAPCPGAQPPFAPREADVADRIMQLSCSAQETLSTLKPAASSVDVCVPCYRLDTQVLQHMARLVMSWYVDRVGCNTRLSFTQLPCKLSIAHMPLFVRSFFCYQMFCSVTALWVLLPAVNKG